MTVAQLQQTITTILNEGGCDSPSFDAVCLLEDIGGIGRGMVPVSGDREVSQEVVDALLIASKKRAEGVPLQYLIGNWDFLGLTLCVGKGVLIPRPETELLCETVVPELTKDLPQKTIEIWDLCAGTGCVGLGVASLLPDADLRVLELELSGEAFPYLEKNIKKYSQYPVTAIKADVLADFARFNGSPTVIVSNPPYIPKDDLDGLQREVRHEPVMALDGGDGFRFYRAIARHWIPKLADRGIAAVEVGVDQAEKVAALFAEAGLSDIRCIRDFAGIERVVIGKRNK